MSQTAWSLVCLIAAGVPLACVVRGRKFIRGTTLGTAWTWSAAATLVWLVAAGVGVAWPESPAASQIWYAACIAALCPWIAVLGARRPGVRVWNWFVVLPLALVLAGPAAISWGAQTPSRPVVEGPALLGFGLAMTMGMGNFLGTRHALTALLCGLAEAAALSTFSSAPPAWGAAPLRAAAAIGYALGAVWACRSAANSPSGPLSWNRVWNDFRNAFGIVWANRLAERVNRQAATENWSVRLDARGFAPTCGSEPDAALPDETARIDQTMRWLLRRFVDDAWIDARLKP